MAEVIKMNRKLRILAGIAGVVLIVILLIITMSFTGNPISKVLATRSADKYVEENYSELDLIREETMYEFKHGSYIVKYYKENSKDIHFGIETDYLGRITLDRYEWDVLSKSNTRNRLDREFSHYVEKLLRDNLDYDYSMILPNIYGDDENMHELDIDMIFDMEDMRLNPYLTIYIFEEDRSWDKVGEIAWEVDKLMEENNLDIFKYSIILEEPRDDDSPMGESIGVYDFPKEKLDSDNLPREMEEFFHGW